MNKETLDLLQQLAAKLGTTADHLWAVLVRQAFISGCIDLLLYAFTIGLIWFSAKKIPQWVKTAQDTDSEGVEIGLIILIATLVLFVVILTIGCLVSVSGTITAFVNPEYWALQQILAAIGGNK